MSYNWEKIFKEKSTQELYNIFKGRTTLTGEAIDYAKRELDNRGFNTEDMERNRISWKISDLIEDDRLEAHDILKENIKHISIRVQILYSVIALVLILLSVYLNDKTLPSIDTVLLIILVILVSVFSHNVAYFKQKKKKEQRKQKLSTLLENLKNTSDPETFSHYQDEFIRLREKLDKRLSRTKWLWNVLWVIGMLLILVFALISISL